jgi:transposase, IS5 family
MLGQLPTDKGDLFRLRLDSMINMEHALVVLSTELDWSWIEKELSQYYALEGRPSVPIRKMVGLLLLKQMYKESDESAVERWIENPYWQYFCGEVYFQKTKPFDPTDFVLFRKRVGETGMEKVLTFTVKLHKGEEQAQIVQMDTTVQEKNITYPTDQKLASRIMQWTRRIAEWTDVSLKQTYEKEERNLRRQISIQTRTHQGQVKRQAASRRMKTIAGRLIRDVERKLQNIDREHFTPHLEFFKEVLNQKRGDKNKVYSIHEPEVSCIAKGKVHKKYEFGCKISICRTMEKGVITAMKSFTGNPYDGDTIEPTLQQLERIIEPLDGKLPEVVVYDRGGRGRSQIGQTTVLTPKPNANNQNEKERKWLKELFRKRSAIEATIGHLKSDFGLGRNFLAGVIGDAVNALLAGAAHNIKMRLREIKSLIFSFFSMLTDSIKILMTLISFSLKLRTITIC